MVWERFFGYLLIWLVIQLFSWLLYVGCWHLASVCVERASGAGWARGGGATYFDFHGIASINNISINEVKLFINIQYHDE